MAIGQEVEEQLSRRSVEGHEAEFVDNEQLDTLDATQETAESEAVASLGQLAHEIRGAGEEHPAALLGGGEPKSESDMSLPGSDWAGDDNIMASVDEGAGGQLGELGRLDAAQRLEVQLGQRLDGWKAGVSNGKLDGEGSAFADLLIQEDSQVRLVRPGVARGFSGYALEVASNRRQAQALEVLFQKGGLRGGRAHGRPPTRSAS